MSNYSLCNACSKPTYYTCTLGSYEVCRDCENDYASNMSHFDHFPLPAPKVSGQVVWTLLLAIAVAATTALFAASCAKSTSDGKDGQSIVGPQGERGLAGDSIIAIVLCPTIPGAYPEVLWRLANGKLYAVYDGNPTQVHETEVLPGHYQTTDGRSCLFTVNNDGSITYP